MKIDKKFKKVIIFFFILLSLVTLVIFIWIYNKEIKKFYSSDFKNFFTKILNDFIKNPKIFNKFSKIEQTSVIIFLLISIIMIISTCAALGLLYKKIWKNQIINQELIYSDDTIKIVNDEENFKNIEQSELACLGIQNITDTENKKKFIKMIYYKNILRINENPTITEIRNEKNFDNLIKDNLVIKIEHKKNSPKSPIILGHLCKKNEISGESQKKFLTQYIQIISTHIQNNKSTENSPILNIEINNKNEIDNTNQIIKGYLNENYITSSISKFTLNYQLIENNKTTNQYVIFEKNTLDWNIKTIRTEKNKDTNTSFAKKELKKILQNAIYFKEKFEHKYIEKKEQIENKTKKENQITNINLYKIFQCLQLKK